MMKSITLLFLLVSGMGWAQECSQLWVPSVEINPSFPKPMSGDTYAVYGLLGYYDEPGLRMEIKGQFPKGRFMSVESYRTAQKFHVDALFDFQLKADEGSINPYVIPSAFDAPNRAFSVSLVKPGQTPASRNPLRLHRRTRIHSMFFRWYVPAAGVVPALSDLPKIYSVEDKTGESRACPRGIDTVYDPGAITALLKLIKENKVLKFKEGSFWNGTNYAIPSYVNAISKVKPGNVSVVQFKVPSFSPVPVGSSAEVRYWSFCIQNLKESETLGCLPDYLSTPDAKGNVTVVVGRGAAVKERALARGFNFLEDVRLPEQEVLAYFYRNLLPRADYIPYQGAYLPQGVVCSEADFLASDCASSR